MPRSADPEIVLQALSEALARAGLVVAAHLWLLDPATDSLRLVHATGPLPPAALPVARRDTVLGRALDESTDVLAPLVRKRGATADASFWRFAMPVEAGETRGVAAIDFQGEAEPDRSLLMDAAPLARGALVGSLALHVARQETAAAGELLEAAQDLSRLLDPPEVVRTILVRGMRMADAITGSVMLLDPLTGSLSIAAAEGLPPDVVKSTSLPKGEGIAGWVIASGESLVVEDLPGRSTRSRRHGVRTAVSVPIADVDGLVGVLNVGCGTYSARFSQATLATLESLGRIGALALRNAQAVRRTGDLYFDTLKTLALALETKDPYSHGGTERVVGCAVALGAAMGLDESESRSLEIAALLHDIGMIATGDASSVRHSPLSTVEWGLLKMHPVVAAELLQQAPTLADVAPIVYHHHEHYDGSGYAAGLAGEDIPLPARVLSVADAFVAMTSERSYRHAMSREDALAELDREAGAQFDPHVVAAFHDVLDAESTEAPAWCA